MGARRRRRLHRQHPRRDARREKTQPVKYNAIFFACAGFMLGSIYASIIFLIAP
jgi:hypothetical protein